MTNNLRNYQRGVPMKDRDQTVAVMNALCTGIKNVDDHHPLSSRDNNSIHTSTCEDVSSVYGEGPLILSNIPDSCRQRSVVLGIDEAGRGSVIGPMVYGMCFWYAGAEAEANVIPKDFNDSKQLNESQRNILFETILQKPDIGFCARILHASEISRNMLRPLPYNLNQMSHNAAIAMIRALVEAKVTIQTCYIDTVGNPASYQRRLEQEFPGIEFIVESKADDTYPPCSAASIVAKVVRDRMITNWKFTEPKLNECSHPRNFGSGYPSDPTCKDWIHQNMIDPIFAYPDVVRFSWGPIKKQLLTDAPVLVEFEADEDDSTATGDDDEKHKIRLGIKRQQEQMNLFLGKPNPEKSKPKRLPYFERRKLQQVMKL